MRSDTSMRPTCSAPLENQAASVPLMKKLMRSGVHVVMLLVVSTTS